MRSFLKWTAIALTTTVLGVALVTYIALEASGVLSIETVDHTTGAPRVTHIWYVVDNNQLFFEAGNPENPWVKDVAIDPNVRITSENLAGAYQLKTDKGSASHHRIRSLMRAKYTWRDAWIGLLFDTSKSTLITASPFDK